eukprot:ANDGO_04330.mRNA.1 Bifunctional delta 6-fatty acyl acetylenase/desaturase
MKVSWSDVEKHNTEDECWTVISGKVYDVSSYLDSHPGGRAVIKTQGGRDGTDAFNSFHPPQVEAMLASFYVGDLDLSTAPKPVQKEDGFVKDMRALVADCKREGLFASSKVYYVRKWIECVSIVALALYLLKLDYTNRVFYYLSAALLGLSFQQFAGVCHDLVHNQVFENRAYGNLVALVFGGIGKSFSLRWWLTKHSAHHASSNTAGDDPDIDTLPLLAWSKKLLPAEYSPAARFFVPLQSFLFMPLLLLARINWVAQSIVFSISGMIRPSKIDYSMPGVAEYYAPVWRSYAFEVAVEMMHWAGLALWCTVVCGMSIANFVLYVAASSSFGGLFLASIFVMNHNGMPILEKEAHVDFFRTQIITSRNCNSSPFVDWFTCGLNFQTEHHIFPTMPRHNYGIVAPRVRAICKKHNVTYTSTGFVEAFLEMFEVLHDVRNSAIEDMAKKDKQRV